MSADNKECLKLAASISILACSVSLLMTRYSIRYIGVRARGARGAAAPLTRAKPLFFGQKLNFSGRSQQAKIKKIYIFVFFKRKKTEFIPSS